MSTLADEGVKGIPKSGLGPEFDILQAVQVQRMAAHDSIICHERCVTNYWLNNFYLNEKSCMKNCFEKLNQTLVITNVNSDSYERSQRTAKR